MSDPPTKTDDPAFAAHAETIRRGQDEKIQEVKHLIAQWIEANELPATGGTITLALLELGTERHLDLFPNEKDAAELVQGVLQKALRRRRVTVQ